MAFSESGRQLGKGNPYHVSIAQLLIKYEQKLIEEGIIQSDDMFFVLGKSAVL